MCCRGRKRKVPINFILSCRKIPRVFFQYSFCLDRLKKMSDLRRRKNKISSVKKLEYRFSFNVCWWIFVTLQEFQLARGSIPGVLQIGKFSKNKWASLCLKSKCPEECRAGRVCRVTPGAAKGCSPACGRIPSGIVEWSMWISEAGTRRWRTCSLLSPQTTFRCSPESSHQSPLGIQELRQYSRIIH
jgi:hypothetical protein